MFALVPAQYPVRILGDLLACASTSEVLHFVYNADLERRKEVKATMIGADKTQIFAYPPKKLKRRVVAACERRGLSISEVITACLQACIDDLEQQDGLGIKAKPIQVARNKRTLAA